MDGLTTATILRMRQDAVIAGLVSAYRGSPAVFGDDRVPEDAALPYVVSAGSVADEQDDTKTDLGRTVTRDVYVYADHQDTDTVETVAHRVRDLFHRFRGLDIPGWYVWRARAHGPVALSADDYDGRLVTVRWAIAREEPQ